MRKRSRMQPTSALSRASRGSASSRQDEGPRHRGRRMLNTSGGRDPTDQQRSLIAMWVREATNAELLIGFSARRASAEPSSPYGGRPRTAGRSRQPRRPGREAQQPAVPSPDKSGSRPHSEAQQPAAERPRFASIAIASTTPQATRTHTGEMIVCVGKGRPSRGMARPTGLVLAVRTCPGSSIEHPRDAVRQGSSAESVGRMEDS